MTNYDFVKRVLYVHNLYDKQNKIKRIPCEDDNIFVFAHGYCALRTNEIDLPEISEDAEEAELVNELVNVRNLRRIVEEAFVPYVYYNAICSWSEIIKENSKRKCVSILKVNLKVNEETFTTYIQQAFFEICIKSRFITNWQIS